MTDSDNNSVPLCISEINKKFGKKTVLEDINLEVNSGEIFGLIGLNGAGKTTLIKIILGLLDPSSGNASIFENSSAKTQTRKKLSFLPEKFQPSSLLKGREFLSFTLSYYGKKYNHSYAREKAEMLGLDPDVLDWKITKYSKGMGQKLGLLSALLIDRPLLILDEPMSGLDPSARIRLKDNLLSYVKSNADDGNKNTIFFSSHILSDIDEICNRIAVLHDNRMIFIGTPSDFKKKYSADKLERAFLNAIENDSDIEKAA